MAPRLKKNKKKILPWYPYPYDFSFEEYEKEGIKIKKDPIFMINEKGKIEKIPEEDIIVHTAEDIVEGIATGAASIVGEAIQGCTHDYTINESELAHDVKVSSNWNNHRQLKQSAETEIMQQQGYSSNSIGLSTAISKGALIQGKSNPVASVIIHGGNQTRFLKTELLDSRVSGNTKINLKINAKKNMQTGISAATITVIDAKASVIIPHLSAREAANMAYEVLGHVVPRASTLGSTITYLVTGSNVLVEGSAEMSVKTGSCEMSQSKIKAKVKRQLIVNGGNVVSPRGQYWHELDTPVGLTSCTQKNNLKISIDGKIHLKGMSDQTLGGSVNIDSFWASVWYWECKNPRTGETRFGPGYSYGIRYTTPKWILDELQRSCPNTSVEDVTRELHKDIKLQFEKKLETIEGSPIDSPILTETELRTILIEILIYLENSYGLFEESYLQTSTESER